MRKDKTVKCHVQAAQNVAYLNAEREYFDDWDIPPGDQPGPYFRTPSYYETECLDPKQGKCPVSSIHYKVKCTALSVMCEEKYEA